ncbi:MAG: hypothetical protein KBC64_00440 [Simkaniaceae bacterium]|nr:hypothetical protein [Simkaniaceae bacterium]
MRTALILVLITLVGCYQSNKEVGELYHDDGRVKPRVALLPIYDRSGEEFAWSLSDELTHAIYQRIVNRGSLCIADLVEMKKAMPNMNPFGHEFGWLKKSFPEQEFIVFSELVEHNIHPKQSHSSFFDKLTPSCELDMTIRLRIFDLRGDSPEIILQEIIRQTHLIPKQEAITDQDPGKWKHKTYAVSPLGFSHYQLSKEMVSRIEDYILLAKTKR